jgi:hypothetical protein
MSGFARRFAQHWLPLVVPALLLMGGPVASSKDSDMRAGRLQKALEILSHVPTGRELLGKAQHFWNLSRPQEVRSVLKWGLASKTDAVLTRHFNPRTGQESRERQVTIYLREDQSLDDLVLDIAHELVHATSRPGWDPYDPNLTPGRYIQSAIEGEGGEVQAVAAECRVGFEIHERFGAAGASGERCRSYVKGDTDAESVVMDPELIRRDFYRVGRWTAELTRKLGAERSLFPLMSQEAPKLYSSTGNAPYPVALYREFEEITQIACENSRRRVEAAPDRTPAAVQKNAERFVAERCDKSR